MGSLYLFLGYSDSLLMRGFCDHNRLTELRIIDIKRTDLIEVNKESWPICYLKADNILTTSLGRSSFTNWKKQTELDLQNE